MFSKHKASGFNRGDTDTSAARKERTSVSNVRSGHRERASVNSERTSVTNVRIGRTSVSNIRSGRAKVRSGRIGRHDERLSSRVSRSARDDRGSAVASNDSARDERTKRKINRDSGTPLTMCQRVCRCMRRAFYALFALMLVLFGVLYYFLGTLSGARNALELSQRFIPDFIIIDTTIESGSLLTGLKLGHTLVDIRDIVAISADDLTLDYDLSDITSLMFTVNNLESHKLTVALSDKVFEGPSTEDEEDSSEPFRLSFPVDIDIHRFNVSDFAFRSQIVDVEVGSLNSALWARGDKTGTKDTTVDAVTVHLKNDADVAEENADIEAVSKVDRSLAVMVDGKMIRLADLDDASQALVSAAQQGKTVEMVIASEQTEREVETAEDALFKDFNPATASARSDSLDTAIIAASNIDHQADNSSKEANSTLAAQNTNSAQGATALAKNNSSQATNATGERKIKITPDSLVYKNPEDFAKAMESALFNEHKVPVLLNEKPEIQDPRKASQDSNQSRAIGGRSNKYENADAYEKALLRGINANSNEQRLNAIDAAKASKESLAANQAKSAAANTNEDAIPSSNTAKATSATSKGKGTTAVQGTAAAGANGQGAVTAAKANGGAVGANKSTASVAGGKGGGSVAVASEGDRALSSAVDTRLQSKQIDSESQAAAMATVDFIDAVTGATASTIAEQIRNEKSQKGHEIIAKANENKKQPKAVVKAFGSGDGAIEKLPSIVLPFDITMENFKATKVRYYMEGFDTQQADITADASWVGTNLKVNYLTVNHGFGEAKAVGDLNFDRYFDLNFSLSGDGYKNDETHEFMHGLLYGLNGKFTVSGDLTDLRVNSVLNLGGTSELKVHANVLSAALPVMIDLKTKDITYPIFGEPLVNAKQLDLHTAGNLADGIDLSLKANISGFDFEKVITEVKASISYEKARIETFKVNGKYLKEEMMADVKGDVFYGEVFGADVKAKAKIADLAFISPKLRGAFSIDSDLVAIVNEKENARSALAVAGEPVYLPNRIPKTMVKLEDFDADTLEHRLLAQVKKTGVTGKGTVLKGNTATAATAANSAAAHGAAAAGSVSLGSSAAGSVASGSAAAGSSADGAIGASVAAAAGASTAGNAAADSTAAAGSAVAGEDAGTTVASKDANAKKQKPSVVAMGDINSADIASAEEAILSAVNSDETSYVATASAVEAVSKGQALAAVRPLSRASAWTDGVADRPADVLISQQEYVDAVRFVDTTTGATPKNGADAGRELTLLEQIFSKDLPEVMANVRFIKGNLHLNGYKTTIDIEDVVGDIHNGFRVEHLKVSQGDNIVLASGKVAPNGADLNAVIELKHLEYLEPSVTGSISAYINSTGSLKDLNFEFSGSAPKIKSGEFVVRKLIFNAGFNTQTRSINLTALADRLRISKALGANRQCFLDVSGTPLRHNVSASCGGASSAYFTLDGSLNYLEQTYAANLLELYLSTNKAGSLSLEAPVYADINFGSVKGSVSPVELSGEIGKINITKTDFANGDLKTALRIKDFDVSTFSEFMPKGMTMHVPLEVAADVVVNKGKPNIQVSVESNNGFIFHDVGAGVVYDSFALKSHITEKLMHNTVNMRLKGGRGEIDSAVDIKEPAGAGKLAGYFKIIDFDLETLSNIGQSFTELNGMVNLDTKIGGDISSPMLFGKFLAKGSAVPRYDVGQVNAFDLKLALKGQRGLLDGSIVLNGGELRLNGGLDWSQGANGTLTAQAKKLPVFLVGYGTAAADIDTKVTLGEVLDIQGNVDINAARIAVNDVSSSGTSVSADEILVPSEGSIALIKQAKEPPFKSTIDLGIKFGDDVRFSALGMVKGRLSGGIDIYKQLQHKDIRSKGEIKVVDGNADVYGRKFNFSTARVIFNREIANPSLNVEVVADPESLESDVVVGARVTGTAQAPDIKLFSKPSMSENEILSYILYGHGLDKNVATQDTNNSNLLLGMGVSGLSGIAQGIAGALGVENVQVGTQGRGDDTQVELQGYVTRKLRLSYGYGVFNSVGEFKIRYELIRNFYAEFVSSIDQAVDLIYSFEFD